MGERKIWEYVARCHLARRNTIKKKVASKVNKNCYPAFMVISKISGLLVLHPNHLQVVELPRNGASIQAKH